MKLIGQPATAPPAPPDPAALDAASAEAQAADQVLAEPIFRIEKHLSSLAINVPAWVKVKAWDTQWGEFWVRELGYAWLSHQGIWGIAIRETHGREDAPDDERVNIWAFNEAPRKSRLSAIEKLPDLLTDLTKETHKTARRMREKAAEAAALAALLTARKK